MTEPLQTDMSSWLRRSLFFALGAAIVLYAVQLFTPLRLTTDGIYYLSLADAAKQNLSAALQQPFGFPKGYSAFVFLLMKAGLFSAATLVLSNLLLFATGLLLTFRTLIRLGFERNRVIVVCSLTILSVAVVKNITQGMSDFLFFALSAGACWLMTLQSPYKWFAILPCICAVEVRFVGLALFVPFVFIAWSSLEKRSAIILFIIIPLLASLGVGVWAGRRYLISNTEYLEKMGIVRFVALTISLHTHDFAELVLNIPFARLPAWSQPFMALLGGGAMLLFAIGVLVLRRSSPWTFFYLLGYSALILSWPFTDPRFWLPCLPFVFLAIHAGWTALLRSMPVPILLTYVIVFCALGFVALGYSTWLTFSGPKFPYRYGDGRLRATYLVGCSPATGDVNELALHLLRRYEWHCRAEQ